MALYLAKGDGRGTHRFFEREMDKRLQLRRALELDLRKAIANGEFEVYYQPILYLQTGKVSGFEALLRWNHPERGMISPVEFIPLAEETGLILPLGEWVLRTACAQAAHWPQPVGVAVNLSAMQFKGRNLVQLTLNALASSGLAAARLDLEITESVLLQDEANTLSILHQLREIGVRISMDDFGTGYSSLAYLRNFPFDKIKIDRTFVRDMLVRKDCQAIVRAVVGWRAASASPPSSKASRPRSSSPAPRPTAATRGRATCSPRRCPIATSPPILPSASGSPPPPDPAGRQAGRALLTAMHC